MNGRFLVVFALTVTAAVLALAAGRSAVSGGGALATIAFVALALPAALGLAALVRLTYLDASSSRGREGRRVR